MQLDDLDKIWKDQKEFNSYFFPKAKSLDEKCSQTKEFILCSISEMDELLRAIKWKVHRSRKVDINEQHIRNEMTDIFKYFVSKCLVWNISPEDVVKDYWRKSAVCRQRYMEEYILTISNEDKIAVVDIDGVLADYKQGLLEWIDKNIDMKTVHTRPVRNSEKWDCSANGLGITESLWQIIKHRFRTEKGKLDIPMYPCAEEFMDALKKSRYKIIVLTSRPIDRYPNIYTETIEWLNKNNLPFDFLWWSVDKREEILEKNLRNIVTFAIDDDWKQVYMYNKIGIKVYWMRRDETGDPGLGLAKNVTPVNDLLEVLEDLTAKEKLCT